MERTARVLQGFTSEQTGRTSFLAERLSEEVVSLRRNQVPWGVEGGDIPWRSPVIKSFLEQGVP